MTTTKYDLRDLLGYTVQEVWVGPDEHELRLVTAPEGAIPQKTFSLDTEGDCCSESWWADVVGVKQLLGARIREVAEIPMPTPEDDRTRQEVDEAYGLRIKTNRGVCDLVYRNSSNGYYGGSCYGGWVDNVPGDFRPISEDWSAMTTTFLTTHKDHALSRADNARSIAAQRGTQALGAIVANVGTAVVHALLEVADAVNDHARDTR